MPLTLTPIDIGAAPGDGTGDPARTAFDKINENNILIEAIVAAIELALADKQDAADLAADVTALIVGKNSIWIPAAAMRPTVSNGCAALTDVETTSGRPDMTVLAFDKDADEHAQFQIKMPKLWNEGTVTFRAFWTCATAVTTGVAWGLQGVAVGDNSTIDVAYGTPVVVQDDCQSQAEECYVSAESSAITIAGTPTADKLCFFRVFRDVSDANDDLNGDALLIGIELYYTTNALNDA